MSRLYRPACEMQALTGSPAEAYVAGRGIPADVASRTGLKFAPNWLGAPALVAPVRALGGHLVGAHGRYLVARDPKCRSEGEIGEGVFLAHPEALEGAVITLCEGVFDALSLSAAQLPALALIGLAFRPWLVPALKGRVVNLAFDADAAGDAAAVEWEERLAPIKTRRVRPTRGKDWNEEHLAAGLPALAKLVQDEQLDLWPTLVLSALELEPAKIDWIWPYHLARGKITLIEGDPGKGKGLITMDVAARLSRGGEMPDGAPSARSRVLFMTGEDDMADTEMPRLEAAGADLSRIFFLKPREDHNAWRLLEDADTLEEQVRFCGADLLIIDPLTEFLANVDTHRDNEVRVVLGRLRDLAKATRCAVLAVRHLNKGAGTAAIYRGGGSIAFTGAARFVFTVGQDPEDRSRRAFAMTKCNVAPELPTLIYRPVAAGSTARIEWLGKSGLTADQILEIPHDRPKDQAREFLEQALSEGPVAAAEVMELAEKEGISRATIKRVKQQMAVQSAKVADGWQWSIEDQGTHFPMAEK